jgi:hypothetical protein
MYKARELTSLNQNLLLFLVKIQIMLKPPSDLLISANDNCRRAFNRAGSSNGKVRKPLLLF